MYQGPEFGDRAIDPEPLDFYVGVVLIVLLLEATRRSTGWIMPVVSLVFIAYALFGNICQRRGRIAVIRSNGWSAIST